MCRNKGVRIKRFLECLFDSNNEVIMFTLCYLRTAVQFSSSVIAYDRFKVYVAFAIKKQKVEETRIPLYGSLVTHCTLDKLTIGHQ